MSKRDWKILFEDILESIDKIKQYTEEIGFDDFAMNSMIIDAVVRNIEIIGEASKNVPTQVQEKYPHIPWRKLDGIRNRIVHEYFGVDISIIWYIVTNELLQLKQWIKDGLKNNEPSEKEGVETEKTQEPEEGEDHTSTCEDDFES
ncbi:MAG: DUF86 domain-containing protein [Candidatus Aminicenantes bacterium]|nr:DUF86 domain-containing protein [Candidatus Aminicenantes bacterium]NIM77377.1 DUF86 domain-containing protein [Candidatus Aminicenantes bacterium]NIN21336.1 DUF86 domain-containing protein [Candidatus Aminicenantes bacterium]NIN45157.1 DUF86 domain-containing protein [Candidatus Aminicenantes bacterium]NIN87974.1 DUF86 domain-containing protein [Candidatus Aminicenantes bacterium]